MDKGFGKYDVYTVAGSIYCYRDSNVLKNRFGLRDGAKLRAVEADISLLRQRELLENPIQGRFTVSHLCRIHRCLLGDIYPFAGHFRREDIMKGTTRFMTHDEIPRKLAALLGQLRSEHCLSGLSFDDFVRRSAYYFAELNYIHPFREGNGRAIREFMRLLFSKNSYEVDWTAVLAAELLDAMELSIYDTGSLQNILRKCLTEK